jgi:diaminopimelate decarboxylase
MKLLPSRRVASRSSRSRLERLAVTDFGFEAGDDDALRIGGVRIDGLAREQGTPLHVIDEAGLRQRTRRLRRSFVDAYPGPVDTHYAFKCNNTPGVVSIVLAEGWKPEVGTLYEWELARRSGSPAGDIVVNGPGKGPLLERAIGEGAGLIVIDSLNELSRAGCIARDLRRTPSVLLRINPNFVPRGMNRASATGSRRASVFGLDGPSGEVDAALSRLVASGTPRFAGFHCHAGTGIRSPEDYRVPLERILAFAERAAALGLTTRVLDIGGGFGVPTSRELSTGEFLLYQALGRLPDPPRPRRFPPVERFAEAIGNTIASACARRGLPLPRLIVEPGRAVVSGAGVLLVTVHAVKHRRGVGSWVITDGGAGTVAFPMFYEYHEVFLCRDVHAARTHRYHLVGSACHSADWIARNKRMPPLAPGDVLAICDAGAYFTVQESNFGFPRPAIIAVRDGRTRVLRRRETFEDMVARDAAFGGNAHVR